MSDFSGKAISRRVMMPARFLFLLILVFVGLPPLADAKVQSQAVPYAYGETSFEGFLAWDDSVKGQRPGVLVVHEWWGLNEYARDRAEQLAAMGYVAMGPVNGQKSRQAMWRSG
jgi:hypothetical protein